MGDGATITGVLARSIIWNIPERDLGLAVRLGSQTRSLEHYANYDFYVFIVNLDFSKPKNPHQQAEL